MIPLCYDGKCVFKHFVSSIYRRWMCTHSSISTRPQLEACYAQSCAWNTHRRREGGRIRGVFAIK